MCVDPRLLVWVGCRGVTGGQYPMSVGGKYSQMPMRGALRMVDEFYEKRDEITCMCRLKGRMFRLACFILPEDILDGRGISPRERAPEYELQCSFLFFALSLCETLYFARREFRLDDTPMIAPGEFQKVVSDDRMREPTHRCGTPNERKNLVVVSIENVEHANNVGEIRVAGCFSEILWESRGRERASKPSLRSREHAGDRHYSGEFQG